MRSAENKDFEEIMKHMKEGGGMPPLDFNLGTLGLDEEKMKALSAQMVRELTQGTYQFAEEEKLIIEIRNRADDQIGSLLAQNINSGRSFLLTLATLALTIIGAVLSVITSGHSIFKGNFTIHIGLIFLSVCVIVTVLYLLDRLGNENNGLTKRLVHEHSIMDDARTLLRKHIQEKKSYGDYLIAKKAFAENAKKREASFTADKANQQSKIIPYIPAVIGYSFLIGLGFISLGFWF
jgi:hypothetical protein